MAAQRLPILVVGAGPSGLVLALALRKNGIPVRIIDKKTAFHNESRGAGIQPRTLEMLKILGVNPSIDSLCVPLPTMRSYKIPGGVEPLCTWNLQTQLDPSPYTPFTMPCALAQNAHERILRQNLEEYQCRVELATELVSLEQDAEGVTVGLIHRKDETEKEETARIAFVVGADGAHSTVRKQSKCTFLGESRAEDIIVGDLQVQGLDSDHWHIWEKNKDRILLRPVQSGDPVADAHKFTLIAIPKTKGVDSFKDHDSVKRLVHDVSERKDIILGEFTWFSRFRPSARMADKFRDGRVFIVGDAAHVHPPSGGQGLNTCVQDSLNLTWKLALVYTHRARDSLLDTYQEERMPVIATMLSTVFDLHTGFIDSVDDRPKVPRIGNEGFGGWLTDALLMLGINYRWSSITLDERAACKITESLGKEQLNQNAYGGHGSESLAAGDRAPEAPLLLDSTGAHHSVFGLLEPTAHTVLVFPGDTGEAQTREVVNSVRRYGQKVVIICSPKTAADYAGYGADHVLADRDCHAHAAYGADWHHFVAIAIRPDGYVGAVVLEAAGVTKYLTNIYFS